MKKAIASLVLLLSAPLAFAGDWDFGAGYRQGLLYADRWDPGFSGADVSTIVWTPVPFGHIGAGLEFGLIGGAWQASVPVSYRYEYAQWQRLSLGLGLELSSGVALYRPYPLWLWGAAVQHTASIDVGNRWSLGLALGVGYSASPRYESLTGASSSSADLIVRLYARRASRRADRAGAMMPPRAMHP